MTKFLKFHIRTVFPSDRMSGLYGKFLVLSIMITAILASPIFSQTVIGRISRLKMKPTAVAVYEYSNKVFIADKKTREIYIYDGATNKKLGSVKTGIEEVFEMVVDEKYGKLYACGQWRDKKIVVIDTDRNSFIRHIELPRPGTFALIAHDENIHKVYVLCVGGFIQIDVATDSVTKISGISGNPIRDIAINPVTNEVYMTNVQYKKLDIVNGVTLEHIKVPNIIGGGVGINYLENKAYIAYYNFNKKLDRIAVYDRDNGSIKVLKIENDALRFAFNPDSNRIYTSSEINTVSSIIEGKSNNFFNLPLKSPTGTPKIRYKTNHIYYPGMDYIGILDDSTQLLEMIPVENPDHGGIIIQEVAINQTTGRVYVINDGYRLNFVTVIQDEELMTRPPVYFGTDDYIHVFDPGSKEFVEYWDNSFGLGYHASAVRPGGGRLYVPSPGMGFSVKSLGLYAGCSSWNSLIAKFDTGGSGSLAPVLSPDGSKIYITNSESDNVSVINSKTYKVITRVPVGDSPWGIAVTPEGSKLFVANKGSNSVSIIDTALNAEINSISVGARPWGIAVNPSGTKVYVANSGSGTVSVINIRTEAVVNTISVGSEPHWLAFTPNGRYVCVSNQNSDSVSFINTGSDRVIQTVPVGNSPEGICCLPDGSEVYVGTGSNVTVIKTSDYSTSTIPLKQASKFWTEEIVSVSVADPTSRFAGHVISGGSPLKGALVQAFQGGIEKGRAKTNAAGDYSIFNLSSGTYDIEITASGYGSKKRKKRTVSAGQTKIINFNLKKK